VLQLAAGKARRHKPSGRLAGTEWPRYGGWHRCRFSCLPREDMRRFTQPRGGCHRCPTTHRPELAAGFPAAPGQRAIPGVLVAGPVTIFQEMDLQESSSPSQISLLAGHAPTVTAPFEWSWKTTGGAARGVAFTLTDIAGVQSDSKKAFISGIFLGVAGAALIGLMEQLLRPLGSPGKDDPAPETSAGRPGKTGRPKKRRWHVPVEQPTARARSRRS
jgi:hypothetical protein